MASFSVNNEQCVSYAPQSCFGTENNIRVNNVEGTVRQEYGRFALIRFINGSDFADVQNRFSVCCADSECVFAGVFKMWKKVVNISKPKVATKLINIV